MLTSCYGPTLQGCSKNITYKSIWCTLNVMKKLYSFIVLPIIFLHTRQSYSCHKSVQNSTWKTRNDTSNFNCLPGSSKLSCCLLLWQGSDLPSKLRESVKSQWLNATEWEFSTHLQCWQTFTTLLRHKWLHRPRDTNKTDMNCAFFGTNVADAL